MADHVDDVEVVFIEGAAHFIPEEQPADVLERALSFFEGRR